jgi:hypothetical protein
LRTKNIATLGDNGELIFPRQIIPDIAVIYSGLFWLYRIFDEQRNRDRRSAAKTEYITSLFSSYFARSPAVSPQIKHINRAELISQTRPKSVHRVAVKPAGV